MNNQLSFSDLEAVWKIVSDNEKRLQDRWPSAHYSCYQRGGLFDQLVGPEIFEPIKREEFSISFE